MRTTFTVNTLLDSDISLRDKGFFALDKCNLSVSQKKVFALKLVEKVLPIFEKQYPKDKRPRNCIKATKDYNKGKITKDKFERAISEAKSAVRDANWYFTGVYYSFIKGNGNTKSSVDLENTLSSLKAADIILLNASISYDNCKPIFEQAAYIYGADSDYNPKYQEEILQYLKNVFKNKQAVK